MQKLTIAGALLWAMFAMSAQAAGLTSTVDPATLPKAKQTSLGLYLSATDAERAIKADPSIVFIDVRDPAEINFIGHAIGIDAIVPIATITQEYNPKHQSYKMKGNPNFVAEVDKVMAREGKSKNDTLIVMCRSGHRSGAAIRVLIKAGYTQAWNMVEGFEGGKNPETEARDHDGWRNAGLPWTYKIPVEISYPLRD